MPENVFKECTGGKKEKRKKYLGIFFHLIFFFLVKGSYNPFLGLSFQRLTHLSSCSVRADVCDGGKIQGIPSGSAALKLGEQCQKPGEVRGRSLPFAREGLSGAGSERMKRLNLCLICSSWQPCTWSLLFGSILVVTGSEVK